MPRSGRRRVLAWEALVGAPNEVNFWVTASLTRLLCETLGDREELYRELKRIYS